MEEVHVDRNMRTDDAHIALMQRIEDEVGPLTPKRLRTIITEYGVGGGERGRVGVG